MSLKKKPNIIKL